MYILLFIIVKYYIFILFLNEHLNLIFLLLQSATALKAATKSPKEENITEHEEVEFETRVVDGEVETVAVDKKDKNVEKKEYEDIPKKIETEDEASKIIEKEEEVSKKNLRPLAKRRNLVRNSLSPAKVENDDDDMPPLSEVTKDNNSNDKEKILIKLPIENEEVEVTTGMIRRSTTLIEEAVERSTKEFDAKTMKTERKASKPKVSLEKLQAMRTPLSSAQILKLIRLILIISISVYTSYQSSIQNLNKPIDFFTSQTYVKETSSTSSLFEENTNKVENTDENTNQVGWIEFITSATLPAVIVVWWLSSSLLLPLLGYIIVKPKEKEFSIMQFVLNLFMDGFDGILEIIISFFGELSLHVIVGLLTSLVVTFYYNDVTVGSTIVKSNSEMVYDEL